MASTILTTAVPEPVAETVPARIPLMPERSDFLEGDALAADKVQPFLSRALLEAGRTPATVARRLSHLRGAYHQLAAKGLISWETAQDIAAVKAPGVQKNVTPSLTQKQAIALLEAIPSDTLQGIRDLALMSVFFLTGCRVSAVTGACVGHLETDGVEHYLHLIRSAVAWSR